VVVVTRSLDLDLTRPFFTEAEVAPIILTCASAPPDRRAAAEQVAEVIVEGDVGVDLAAALAALYERGVRVVTCEGGPQLNGDLLLADLIDEWALTLAPLLAGGDALRATTGPQPPNPAAMHLDWLLEGDGLLLTRWLRDR
jgi:riboflavin biosynthesis pyrimidine reductase